ncbi:hypothetical protein WR25_00915 [Diploscapter pachys]|uniref:Uncharacterized protein n=1 Tax=Diploscapter pachys TaxID=2018661 RepID=A0A2A2KVK3_9BILA|nr:hypothetical protein WR25_00915 [Diploscapter pachys]
MQGERVGLATCQQPLTRETKELAYLEDLSLQLDTKKCTQGEKQEGGGKEYWSKEGTPTWMRGKGKERREEADSCQMESEKDIDNDRCMFGMEADHNRN